MLFDAMMDGKLFAFRAFWIFHWLDWNIIENCCNFGNHEISIFAVSTYNTDYILIKSENYQRGLEILEAAGYKIVD